MEKRDSYCSRIANSYNRLNTRVEKAYEKVGRFYDENASGVITEGLSQGAAIIGFFTSPLLIGYFSKELFLPEESPGLKVARGLLYMGLCTAGATVGTMTACAAANKAKKSLVALVRKHWSKSKACA